MDESIGVPLAGGAHGPLNLPIGVFLFGALALVMVFFAFAQGNFNLHTLPFEIESDRDQRHALGCHQMRELDDFGALEQQLSRAFFCVIPDVSVRPWADVHLAQPSLVVVVKINPAIGQVDFATADGFDLSSAQNNASLPLVADLVLVESLAVCDYGLDSRFFQTKIPQPREAAPRKTALQEKDRPRCFW